MEQSKDTTAGIPGPLGQSGSKIQRDADIKATGHKSGQGTGTNDDTHSKRQSEISREPQGNAKVRLRMKTPEIGNVRHMRHPPPKQ